MKAYIDDHKNADWIKRVRRNVSVVSALEFGDVEGHDFHGNQWTGPFGERLDPLTRSSSTNVRPHEPLDIDKISMSELPKNIQDKVMNTIRDHVGDPKELRDNMEAYMAAAMANPQWKEEGMQWYEKQHEVCQQLSEETGIPPENIAAALAAMSSGTTWEAEQPILEFMADHIGGQVNLNDEKLDLVNGKLDAYAVVDRAHEISAELRDKESEAYAAFTKEFPNGEGLKEAWAELHPEGFKDASLNRPDQTLYGEVAALRENAEDPILGDHITNGINFSDLDSRTAVISMQAEFMQEPSVKDGGTRESFWGAGHGWDGFQKGLTVMSPTSDGTYPNVNQVLEGAKIRSFVNNIMDPTDPRDVTIDVHMVSAAANDPSVVNDSSVMGSPRYQTASIGAYPWMVDQVTDIADEYGVLPQQAQALIWVAYVNGYRNES